MTHVRTRTVQVAGRPLHLREAGTGGTPLVLLHGTGVDSAGLSFADSLPVLARQRRVLALDWPGYGDAAAEAALLTADMNELLAELLRIEGLSRVHLLGFSMGASAALHVALTDPSRVERLVLVSPYGLGGKQYLPLVPYIALRAPGAARILLALVSGQRWALRAFLRLLVTVGGPALPDEVLEEVQRGLRRGGPTPAFVDWLRSELRPLRHLTNHLPHLPRVSAPTLLLHGRRDVLVPAWRSYRAAKRLPCARLEILPCGHWLPRERREDFERLVLEWLEDPCPCGRGPGSHRVATRRIAEQPPEAPAEPIVG